MAYLAVLCVKLQLSSCLECPLTLSIMHPIGPVAHLVRGLCGRVLHNMMEDLRAEVTRREQLVSAGEAHSSTCQPPACAALMFCISLQPTICVQNHNLFYAEP